MYLVLIFVFKKSVLVNFSVGKLECEQTFQTVYHNRFQSEVNKQYIKLMIIVHEHQRCSRIYVTNYFKMSDCCLCQYLYDAFPDKGSDIQHDGLMEHQGRSVPIPSRVS